MLCSLYQGNVNIWNYETQTLVKTFEVCDLPVRAAKFVPRKNWVVTGSDDMHIRVFNYNTLERFHSFEAHSDYVRCIAVHPTQPFILTSSGMLKNDTSHIFLLFSYLVILFILHIKLLIS